MSRDLHIVRWLSQPYPNDAWRTIVGKFDVIPANTRRWSGIQWIRDHTHVVALIRGARRWKGPIRFGQALWEIVAKATQQSCEIHWFYEPIRAGAGAGRFDIVDVADGHNTVGPVVPAQRIAPQDDLLEVPTP